MPRLIKPFSVHDLGNPLVWHDCMKKDSLTLSGANVTGVRDLSPYRKTFTATSNPQYSDTRMNGKPGIQYNASGTILTIPDDADFTLATWMCFIAFSRAQDAGSAQPFLRKGAVGTNNLEFSLAISSGDVFNPNASTNGTGATTTFSVGSAGFAVDVPYIGCIGYDGTNVFGAHLAGTTLTENSSASAALHNGAATFSIGGSFSGMNISEVILYPASRPIQHRRLMMQNMAQKWIR